MTGCRDSLATEQSGGPAIWNPRVARSPGCLGTVCPAAMPMVMFLGEVRKAAGRATLDVKADSVGGLLATLRDAVNPAFAELLCRGGALQPDVEVLVNGRNIEFMQGLDTALRPADQVTIFYSGVRGFPGG